MSSLQCKNEEFSYANIETLFIVCLCMNLMTFMQLDISLEGMLLTLRLTSARLWPVSDGDVLAIKEHLIDELDYILVPTEGWNKLVSWYGLTDGQEPIARKVCFLISLSLFYEMPRVR